MNWDWAGWRRRKNRKGGWLSYRSRMVMSGETRPEAQTAAVKSERIRHGRLFVFHW